MKPMWIDVEREAAGITIDPELGYHIRRAAQEQWMADAARNLTVQAAHHTMYRRHLALANGRERISNSSNIQDRLDHQ